MACITRLASLLLCPHTYDSSLWPQPFGCSVTWCATCTAVKGRSISCIVSIRGQHAQTRVAAAHLITLHLTAVCSTSIACICWEARGSAGRAQQWHCCHALIPEHCCMQGKHPTFMLQMQQHNAEQCGCCHTIDALLCAGQAPHAYESKRKQREAKTQQLHAQLQGLQQQPDKGAMVCCLEVLCCTHVTHLTWATLLPSTRVIE